MFELPPSHLSDLPANEETYLGHGSFGTVKRCLYRGLDVAVKEYFSFFYRCQQGNDST